MKSFAGILSQQLANFGRDIACFTKAMERFGPESRAKKRFKVNNDDESEAGEVSNSSDDIDIGVIHAKFHDPIGCKHWVAQYPMTVGRSGKRYTMARKCSLCMKNTCCFCYQCEVPLCYPIGPTGARASHNRQCFKEHVKDHSRKSPKRTSHMKSELIE